MSMRIKSLARVTVATVIGLAFATQVFAAWPRSVVGGTATAYRKAGKGTPFEIRKRSDDKTYDIVVLKDDKVIMYTQPQGMGAIEVTPLKTYNVEKLKASLAKQRNGADGIITMMLKSPEMKAKKAIFRAITTRETEDGKLEYLVHAYDAVGGYKKAYVIDGDTWQLKKDTVQGDDPGVAPWSKEQEDGVDLSKRASTQVSSSEADAEAEAAKDDSGDEPAVKATEGEGGGQGEAEGAGGAQKPRPAAKKTSGGLGGGRKGAAAEK